MNDTARRRSVATLLSLLDRRDNRAETSSPLLAEMVQDLAAVRADIEELKGVGREQWVADSLEAYVEEVRSTTMTDTTKRAYIRGARQFVRWIMSDFEPGGAKR